MDWFSWLSKTSLEPSLVYHYGVTFAQNELQFDDISYFNHEFLLSMGISIAKHRLEIIKQANREQGRRFQSLTRIASAIGKAKRGLLRRARKLLYNADSASSYGPEMKQLQVEWKNPITNRRDVAKEQKEERLMIADWSHTGFSNGGEERIRIPGMSYSGPLDRKLVKTMNRKNMSGPLNFYHPPQMNHSRSPQVARASSPIHYKACTNDRRGNHGNKTFWATLFQDMKPT